VITIILGVCAGLHFAHEMRRVDGRPMGIVHRDVSPGNVFITFNGEVKLVDFGIAKVLSSSRTTQDRHAQGQARVHVAGAGPRRAIDRRSDIFAIGILLYEMVTLTHLFDDDNEFDLMTQIAAGEVPAPVERRPASPPSSSASSSRRSRPPRGPLRDRPRPRRGPPRRSPSRPTTSRLSLALKQSLERLIGDAEYPWYLDEEGPDEAPPSAKLVRLGPPRGHRRGRRPRDQPHRHAGRRGRAARG
jgi:serine/threonine protein kinase